MQTNEDKVFQRSVLNLVPRVSHLTAPWGTAAMESSNLWLLNLFWPSAKKDRYTRSPLMVWSQCEYIGRDWKESLTVNFAHLHYNIQSSFFCLSIPKRDLGPVQRSYFTWAESNANEGEQRIFLICIRFGSCEVRRLNLALDTKKTTPNIEVWPENLGAMLEYWYIERGLFRAIL